MPPPFPRPSNKEIHRKVNQALEALRDPNRSKSCFIAKEKHLPESWDFLGVVDKVSFWDTIQALLEELRQIDPTKYYVGSRPPQRSYETGPIAQKELWAYAWESAITGHPTYLKFVIVPKKKQSTYEGASAYNLFFLDCHENRPPKY
ncbi:MAG: hypothetical protein JJT75_10970 [Opitutales bacterium]|nr:hypothetical protein [Opitutales bacterium]MCH8539791.1 hypothetical protein [Opitutales bacterium]